MRFNERTDADHGAAVPAVSRPVNSTPEEYEARLWRETDASLRRDPSRWKFKSARDLSFSTASRGLAGEQEERGLRAYVHDADDRRAVAAEERRERERYEQARRREAARVARSRRAQEGSRRGWATRRARAQAAAQTQAELG